MLNLRHYIFLASFQIAGLSSIMAQDNSNPTIETPNENNFVAINIVPPPEATVTINQDPKINTLLDVKSKMEKDGDFSDRYKIQLYNGNLNKANDVLNAAREFFPQWSSSLQYETPNYKVWIGNYRTKLKMDRALLEIKKEFPNAFPFKPEKK